MAASQCISWSDLPSELLSIILGKLNCDEISRCAAVCSSWQSAITVEYYGIKSISPPFLLFSRIGLDKYNDFPESHLCILFNRQTNQTHEIPLRGLRGRWFSSSSHGWLLTIDRLDETKNIYLVNPFIRSRIELPPPRRQFRHSHGLRVITSTSPLDPNCVVLASEWLIGDLAVCRPGDTTWTSVQVRDYNITADDIATRVHKYHWCFDKEAIGKKRKTKASSGSMGILKHELHLCVRKETVFYKGNFYYTGQCGIIYRIRFDTGPLPVAEALPIETLEFRQRQRAYSNHNYLVELNGDLLLVARLMCTYRIFSDNSLETRTFAFEVYKLDWQRQEWNEVKDIGNKAILLGAHSSTCFTEGEGSCFKANCIYFIDDYKEYDIGVYDMIRESFKLLQSPFINTGVRVRARPLNWLRVGPGI